MSEFKWTKGPWHVFNMVNENGDAMTPAEIGEYVKTAVTKGDSGRFMFISTADDGAPDICHVGNGPDGPYNAKLIGQAPSMFEIVNAVAHIGVDFGHGEFDINQGHIDKARALVEAITNTTER